MKTKASSLGLLGVRSELNKQLDMVGDEIERKSNAQGIGSNSVFDEVNLEIIIDRNPIDDLKSVIITVVYIDTGEIRQFFLSEEGLFNRLIGNRRKTWERNRKPMRLINVEVGVRRHG
jgi:hypothetical protein